MTLCVECRFFKSETNECAATPAAVVDYLRGEHKAGSAIAQRNWDHRCGPDAKWFQPLAPLGPTP